MRESIDKLKSIFRSPALRQIAVWSETVKKTVVLIAGIEVISALLSLAITLTLRDLINAATGGRIPELWMRGILLTLMMIAGRLLSLGAAVLRSRAAAGFQKELQGKITSSIMEKEYASLKHFHSGELVSRIFSDVSVVKNGVLSLVPSLLNTATSFVGATVILVMMDWRFILLLFISAVVGAILTVVFREPMKRRHKCMQEAEAALHAATQENLENIYLMKASVSEKRALEHMDRQRELLVKEQLLNSRISITLNNSMAGIFDVSHLICYLWGCLRILQGSLTYGDLAALIQLIGRVQNPVANAVGIVSQTYGMIASAERLMEISGLPKEEDSPSLDSFDEIRLESVSFRYEDGTEDVLQGVNATIKRGEFMALTGISGAGKTTLFKLLLGIYRPTAGSVSFVSGQRSVPAGRGMRNTFAYVPQGNSLMSGTLRENLTLFAGDVSEEALRDAVHAACLDELVDEIGLQARLGERGVGLSEGQAQRVSIARALLSGAPILLLDESTSALDEATEAKVLQNISGMKEKTIIAVTHRRAALAICDQKLHIE